MDLMILACNILDPSNLGHKIVQLVEVNMSLVASLEAVLGVFLEVEFVALWVDLSGVL